MAREGRGEVPVGPALRHAELVADHRRRRRRPWLLSAPFVVSVVSLILQIELESVSGLLSAVGLFSAAMLGVFVQLASWRVKFSDRASRYRYTEAPNRDRLDAAVHMTLTATVVAMVLAACLVVMELKIEFSFKIFRELLPDRVEKYMPVDWLARQADMIPVAISAAFLAALTWLLISFIFIVSDLRATYNKMLDAEMAEAEQQKAFKRHQQRPSA